MVNKTKYTFIESAPLGIIPPDLLAYILIGCGLSFIFYKVFIKEKEIQVEIPKNAKAQHFVMLLGGTQMGKDTFAYNCFPEDAKNQKVEMGDGRQSKTQEFQLLSYNNAKLIPGSKGYMLNTIGLGDTSGKFSDDDLIIAMHELCLKVLATKFEGVDTFIFIQDITSPQIVEKVINLMKSALGVDIAQSSIIIATKGNTQPNQQKLKKDLESLQELAKRQNIKGGVYDFRGLYLDPDSESAISIKNASKQKSTVNVQNQIAEIGQIIQQLPPFQFKELITEFYNEVKAQKKIIRENSKKYEKVTETVKKTIKERRWYTFYLKEHEIVKYEYYTILKEIYSIDNDQARIEAEKIILEKRKKSLQDKFNQIKIKNITLDVSNISK